jgi:Mn-dependent DtxR family transcriptional regulator
MNKTSRKKQPRVKSLATAPDAVPTISTEDYLERIGELIERKGYARVVDIAAVLEVSQPSVTAMVKRLAEAGYLNYEKYRGLVMTDKGRELALKIQGRHATLKRFLSLLGLDEATQENDIEGWEHCLSAATLQRLADVADYFEAKPGALETFLRQRQSRQDACVIRAKRAS